MRLKRKWFVVRSRSICSSQFAKPAKQRQRAQEENIGIVRALESGLVSDKLSLHMGANRLPPCSFQCSTASLGNTCPLSSSLSNVNPRKQPSPELPGRNCPPAHGEIYGLTKTVGELSTETELPFSPSPFHF